MSTKKNNAEQAIFDEIETEIAELEEDFGDLGLDDDDGEASSNDLDELEAALAGTEFGAEAAESSSIVEFSVLQIADGVTSGSNDEEGIGDWLKDKLSKPIVNVFKRRAKKLIKRLLKLVRRAAKYRSCIPKVMLAVGAFKAGKYGTSLKLGWAAYRCIRSKS